MFGVAFSREAGTVVCVLNWEGRTVGNCWQGWGLGGWNCLGRVERYREGGFVSGWCYCHTFFLVVLLWLTLSPSRCKIALQRLDEPAGVLPPSR